MKDTNHKVWDDPLAIPKVLRDIANRDRSKDPPPRGAWGPPRRSDEEKKDSEEKLASERAGRVAAEREKKIAAMKNRVGKARAIKSREGEFKPGSRWDARQSRWVHPTVEKEQEMAAQMSVKLAEYNALIADAAASGRSPKGFKPVKKFESLAAAQKRIDQLRSAVEGPPESPPTGGSGDVASGEPVAIADPPADKEDDKMSNRSALKVKSQRTVESIRRPVGKVSDFKPVRAGSSRATVLRMSNGKNTVDQIASKIESDRKTVLTHLFCMHRDCAIGYEVKGSVVRVDFPGNKTIEDAIKQKAE